TIGLLRRSDRRLHRDAATRSAFISHMEQTVRQLYNHPCICYWTIFNEGWGQFCSSEMYARLQALDGSRFIDSASGWFAGGDTDVDSRHVYFRKVKLPRRHRADASRPLVLSEFGGYTWKPEGHVYNTDKTYGYGGYSTREEFVNALRSLYTEQVLPLISHGLCAAVYTQVSDVEDETNGLLSFDREVLKVLPAEFADVSETLIKSI
ncbi:MAG: glycoside hydrolase family 2, partial [Firmicutes bacterium]|nr:glycoside hydrolase family 2 [Bacillota bacterium]